MKRTITLVLSALLLGNNLIAQGNPSISCLPNPKSESGTSIQLKGILSRSKSKIVAVVVSPDSRRLAVATSEKSTALWNMESGQLVAMLDGRISHFFFYGSFKTTDAFSRDGQTLITINGKEAKLWDASTGHLRYLLRGHGATIRSIAFSPDGKQVATGSIDGTVRLWNTWTGQLNSTLAVYRANNYPRWRIISRALSISDIDVYFSPDNKHVLTAPFDQPTKLWDSSSGQLEAILGEKNLQAKFSPSGRFVLTQSDQFPGGSDLWETASGRLKLTFTSQYSDPEFSPNEQWLGFVEYQGYEGLLNLNSMKVEIRLSIHPSFITSTLFSPTNDTFSFGEWA